MPISVERKFRIYDVMHRSAVGVCMAVTVLGHLYLGYRGVKYYMFDRSDMREKELRRIKDTADNRETLPA